MRWLLIIALMIFIFADGQVHLKIDHVWSLFFACVLFVPAAIVLASLFLLALMLVVCALVTWIDGF